MLGFSKVILHPSVIQFALWQNPKKFYKNSFFPPLLLINQALALELTDLEPQVNQEVEAAQQLLESHSEDVPPQLFTALEKDQRSLSRTFSAAKKLAESALQGMQSHRDAQKVRQKSKL